MKTVKASKNRLQLLVVHCIAEANVTTPNQTKIETVGITQIVIFIEENCVRQFLRPHRYQIRQPVLNQKHTLTVTLTIIIYSQQGEARRATVKYERF